MYNECREKVAAPTYLVNPNIKTCFNKHMVYLDSTRYRVQDVLIVHSVPFDSQQTDQNQSFTGRGNASLIDYK